VTEPSGTVEAVAKAIRASWGPGVDYCDVARAAIAALPTPSDQEKRISELVKPWATYDGDLPDYDHPLRCVFESGAQYAVELLAKTLKVTDYTPCDGTEEYEGDLDGTLMNIVLAAMPEDENGDRMWPDEVRAALHPERTPT